MRLRCNNTGCLSYNVVLGARYYRCDDCYSFDIVREE